MFSANTSQVSNDVKYIEDFFSAWLRTGTGSSQTVTTGIKENTGALVISKSRSAATDWAWYDTFRGSTKDLVSNSTAAETTQSQGLTSFNADGHTWGTLAKVNTNGATYVDYVLKPTPKFFDVVTFNQSGASSGFQTVSHNLGSVPGCIIIKRISSTSQWYTYHRSTPNDYLILNSTAAATNTTLCQNLTSTTFDWNKGDFGQGDGTDYVAYLFAHNAGGFGLTNTDNVISCGSFTTDGSGNITTTLGYEPQFLLYKPSSTTGNWNIADNMRGWANSTAAGSTAILRANLSDAEVTTNDMYPTATGFTINGIAASTTYIYIAIRRGPMKTPTSGTSVFAPVAATTSNDPVTVGFPLDLILQHRRDSTTNWNTDDRLRGLNINSVRTLYTNNTDAEYSFSGSNVGYDVTNTTMTQYWFGTGYPWIYYFLRRAPGFFDEVCYTGTGVATTVAHNLGVAPELMIVKARQTVAGYNQDWLVYQKDRGYLKYLVLNISDAEQTGYSTNPWTATPSASSFSVGSWEGVNFSGYNYVAYLFASCPGVSKVGSFTNSGSDVNVDCGFTAGARFILIKRSSGVDDWYVYDSARGITTGNDPYLTLNTTAAEVTNSDGIAPLSSGFTLKGSQWNNGTYIFLAIA